MPEKAEEAFSDAYTQGQTQPEERSARDTPLDLVEGSQPLGGSEQEGESHRKNASHPHQNACRQASLVLHLLLLCSPYGIGHLSATHTIPH